ncbi:hypothetical protein [Streptomyces sp. NWU339]|uniref:hypothetical protein n=1 Tax=Streptomyces sp. NWU339 TaxID=2185284 RepID=UPI0015E7EF05|nr:hypothetical protein [Streptomyces sp. NWU339]
MVWPAYRPDDSTASTGSSGLRPVDRLHRCFVDGYGWVVVPDEIGRRGRAPGDTRP